MIKNTAWTEFLPLIQHNKDNSNFLYLVCRGGPYHHILGLSTIKISHTGNQSILPYNSIGYKVKKKFRKASVFTLTQYGVD